MNKFSGSYTAIVTPFDSDGKIDYPELDRLVEYQIKGGIDGFVALGTTGEAPTIEDEEQEEIVKRVVARANKRCRVIVGTSSNSTAHAIRNTKMASRLGADAALVVTPYYNKPTNEGIYRHFKAIAECSPLPIIVYNIMSRTAKNIDMPTMLRLAAIPGIVGVKESSGDLNQMMDVVAQVKARYPDFVMLSGDDAMLLPLMSIGGDGIISTIGNLVPDRIARLTKAALAGDYETARKEHYWLLPLIKAAFIETNPVPIKAMMTLAGLPAGSLRLPMCEIGKENLAKVRQAMIDQGLLKA